MNSGRSLRSPLADCTSPACHHEVEPKAGSAGGSCTEDQQRARVSLGDRPPAGQLSCRKGGLLLRGQSRPSRTARRGGGSDGSGGCRRQRPHQRRLHSRSGAPLVHPQFAYTRSWRREIFGEIDDRPFHAGSQSDVRSVPRLTQEISPPHRLIRFRRARISWTSAGSRLSTRDVRSSRGHVGRNCRRARSWSLGEPVRLTEELVQFVIRHRVEANQHQVR